MAVGLPGIVRLTDMVGNALRGAATTQFNAIKAEIGGPSDVESILNRLRLYRELIGHSDDREYLGIKGADAAKTLDSRICAAISEAVSVQPPGGLRPHTTFVQWIRSLHSNRTWPVEVFTTNYDLLLEQAMEAVGLPFFDGFVGSVTPFFVPESIEAADVLADAAIYPPRGWTRLWKLHGSINWHLRRTGLGRDVVTRVCGSTSNPGDELAIFPSREKYAQSRKLPFIAFQDRLRAFFSGGECLLVILGYSFSDQHINDILFQGLRSNPRAAILALVHSALSKELLGCAIDHRNLACFGADQAIVGGLAEPWSDPAHAAQSAPTSFWDMEAHKFTLGDFSRFADYLERFVGFPPVPAQQSDESAITADRPIVMTAGGS
jgi:hypothetical protein